MNIEVKNIAARVEKAVEWRVERLIKNRKKARNSSETASTAQTQTDFSSQIRTKWGESWYREPLVETQIFYESFAGNNALCNPEAIFRYLLENSEFRHLSHVWALKAGPAREEFDRAFADYPNVKSVEYKSVSYFRALSTSKYLFNNATFPWIFTKRENQVYVNTWHGTPLKKMGYDMPDGATGANNILRNFAAADYLISPNTYTTQTMYEDAYRLKGMYQGVIIEEGYPRIDHQFSTDSEKLGIFLTLKGRIPTLDSQKRTVVYAPTWKGTNFGSPNDEADTLLDRVVSLQAAHGTKYQFLLKVHQSVYDSAVKNEKMARYLIPNSIPTNEVLAIADTLVTDYSSIFFDFLATGKPIIFFSPDQLDYETNRGLYIDPETLPGPVISNFTDLVDIFANLHSGTPQDIVAQFKVPYEAAKEKYTSIEDGNSTSRIVDIIFRKNTENNKLVKIDASKKTSMLIFLGGMMKNGITTSALNMLHNLDYERFDVSVLVPAPTKNSDLGLYQRIDPRARQFMRYGSYPATIEHLVEYEKFLGGKNNADAELKGLAKEVFATEWARLFGSSTFDHIIDFSGYSGFWSNILIQGPAKHRSVWMHNNLIADAARTVNGRMPNKATLLSQFNTYKHFDNLVSVSEALEEINAVELRKFAPRQKFKSASNTLNETYIRSLAFDATRVNEVTSLPLALEASNLKEAVSQISDRYGLSNLKSTVDAVARLEHLMPNEPGGITFVTAGRLSPEKNHERLIRAFALARADFDNIRLVILGEGPLKSHLIALIRELSLSDSVTLAGHVDNPYEILAGAQCFVLSSDYEGQPMVILEALTLGLPVLTVDFGSVRSSMGPNNGWVVPQTVDDLAQGIRDFAAGDLKFVNDFNAQEFNSRAMASFYSAIGA